MQTEILLCENRDFLQDRPQAKNKYEKLAMQSEFCLVKIDIFLKIAPTHRTTADLKTLILRYYPCFPSFPPVPPSPAHPPSASDFPKFFKGSRTFSTVNVTATRGARTNIDRLQGIHWREAHLPPILLYEKRPMVHFSKIK